MGRFVLGKSVRLALLLVAVATVSFFLLCASPVDPIRAYVGEDVMRTSPEQRHKIAERWGLDQPATIRYLRWLGRIAHGDLGWSKMFDRSVLAVIAEKSRLSAGLMAMAWCFAGLVGFAMGVLAGAQHGSILDRCIRWLAYGLASAPSFWLGMILLMVFALTWQIAPTCCATPPGQDPASVSFLSWVHHVMLPALTLGLAGIPAVLLHTRQKLIDVLASDYVLFARAQGASLSGTVFHHGLRNICLPAINVHFASFSELFAGAILAEQVFAYPGLGQATVQAGLHGDVPLLLGIVLVSAVFVFCGNAIADWLGRWLDPRIRLGESA